MSRHLRLDAAHALADTLADQVLERVADLLRKRLQLSYAEADLLLADADISEILTSAVINLVDDTVDAITGETVP
jgi:hypothetical protein